ncbi:MAG: hypothetical protein HUJ69_03310 [Lachnospiraceae bacterium]|nr:hypothetical protein [Lachnospiraceae bacterium]
MEQNVPKKEVPLFYPLIVLVALVLWVIYTALRDMAQVSYLLGISLVGFLLGIIIIVMAFRYGTCTARARKSKNKATGTVKQIIKETGFSGSFAMSSTATYGVATRWGGRGGIWTAFFMLWNEIRPDHWFPLVEFTDAADKTHQAIFQYGGLKKSFREGDTVEVSWDKYPERIAPLSGKWLSRKAAIYGIIGFVMTVVGAYGFGTAFMKLMESIV